MKVLPRCRNANALSQVSSRRPEAGSSLDWIFVLEGVVQDQLNVKCLQWASVIRLARPTWIAPRNSPTHNREACSASLPLAISYGL